MKQSGDLGEIEAIKYLKSKGYQIIETNFKFGRVGELDIVSKIKGLYVFVEVKYRSSDRFGSGEESINFYKKQKLKKTINYYCLTHKIDLELARFDVITILGYTLNHYENIEL